MNKRLIALIAGMAMAGLAGAQSRPAGVTESTDPARAAAVELAAREIQQRAAQRASSGQAATSAAIVQGSTPNGDWQRIPENEQSIPTGNLPSTDSRRHAGKRHLHLLKSSRMCS